MWQLWRSECCCDFGCCQVRPSRFDDCDVCDVCGNVKERERERERDKVESQAVCSLSFFFSLISTADSEHRCTVAHHGLHLIIRFMAHLQQHVHMFQLYLATN